MCMRSRLSNGREIGGFTLCICESRITYELHREELEVFFYHS